MITRLSLSTRSREQLIEVTQEVAAVVRDAGVTSGVVTLFVPHPTAAVTINENADPSVVTDLLKGLSDAVPRTAPYRHTEGNSDSHIKATLVGPSLQVLVEEGRLVLGTWQGIYFCEFDGPRSRQVLVRVD